MSKPRDRAAGYETDTTPGAPAGSAPSGAPGPRHAEPGYVRDDYSDGRAVSQSGFTYVAATLMIPSVLFSVREGLVANFRTGAYFTTQTGYTLQFSLHSWGWIH